MSGANKSIRRIAITTGDPDGIGLEVASKALRELGPQRGVQFVLYRSPLAQTKDLNRLDRQFGRLTLFESDDAWRQEWEAGLLLDVCSPRPAYQWVMEAALACQNNLCDGLVTGPLSKFTMRNQGRRELGHTELLAHISKKHDLFMSFLGEHFAVLLVTGHIPLQEVPRQFNRRRLSKALDQAERLRQLLPRSRRELPIAVVGLNPHAGERGLIGQEEARWLVPAIAAWRRQRRNLVGPLVPDAAFLPERQKRFSVFVCPYHDQGLIPFKLVHGFSSGVHITMGLPFVRTSVDHGTAKDIFGLDRAVHGSMRDALIAAVTLTNPRRRSILAP